MNQPFSEAVSAFTNHIVIANTGIEKVNVPMVYVIEDVLICS